MPQVSNEPAPGFLRHRDVSAQDERGAAEPQDVVVLCSMQAGLDTGSTQSRQQLWKRKENFALVPLWFGLTFGSGRCSWSTVPGKQGSPCHHQPKCRSAARLWTKILPKITSKPSQLLINSPIFYVWQNNFLLAPLWFHLHMHTLALFGSWWHFFFALCCARKPIFECTWVTPSLPFVRIQLGAGGFSSPVATEDTLFSWPAVWASGRF